MEIGGFFPFAPTKDDDNAYVKRTCPDASDIVHLMSGRCSIYFCLQDSMLSDKKRVAYLPAYDCETVIGCFVKAGYEIYYYDVDQHLVPQFDEALIPKISFLLICGYYGYSTYDMEFVKKCRKNGVTIMQDTTHTAFSPTGACPEADYISVSLRKWMGVISGGLAIKRNGKFNVLPLPADEKHLSIRNKALKTREEYEKTGNEALNKESSDAFWEAEFMLREIFDMQAGDEKSLEIIKHYPLVESITKRRENYAYLLEHLPNNPSIHPIFPYLPDDVCPMFFAFLVDDRDSLMKHLSENQIPPKVYWPVPPFIDIKKYPGAQYIYTHVMSISCDQRFSTEDMQKVVETFQKFG
ncbi:MAG: DegT/DnrJ/EryC1/StrS family aminotransferase [Lachnospiraceae bacterium]